MKWNRLIFFKYEERKMSNLIDLRNVSVCEGLVCSSSIVIALVRGCWRACCCNAARKVLGHWDETTNCSPHDGTDIPPSGLGARGSMGGTTSKWKTQFAIIIWRSTHLLILLHYPRNILSLVYVLDANQVLKKIKKSFAFFICLEYEMTYF